jgi:L-amino acid N-acyltransferase YncA
MAGDEGLNRVVIRPATFSDIPKMLEMGKSFFEASGYSEITTYDPESFGATLEALLNSNQAVVLVAGDFGMAAALVYPLYFQAGHRTAQEMFWWVDKEHRGVGTQLFDALLAGCKAKGAESLSMIALERLTPEKVGGIYERRGFRLHERSYIKKL